jgi:hypothetical protein
MISGYSIQAFTPDKFLLIKELYRSAYGIELDPADFKSKYSTEKLGSGVMGFLAIHNETNSPAAYYGVFPVMLLINGRQVLAAQSGDTMTHRNHQKKGLFVELAKITFETCRERGLEIVFGLPNTNSYHGFTKRLNWKHVDDVERFDLKTSLKTFPLPKLFYRLGLKNLYHSYADRLLKKYIIPAPADFTNSIQTDFGKILRNGAYLEYKNERNKFFLRINEATCWVKLSDVFWIGDVDAYDKLDSAVLHKLKQLAFKLGYNTIVFHINKSIPKAEFLSAFKKHETEPLCFHYLNPQYENTNLLITAADFDTW